MPLNIEVKALQAQLLQNKASWTAEITPLSQLPEDGKMRRLGAAPPNGRVELQQREVTARQAHVAAAAAGAAPAALSPAWDWRDVGGRDFVTPVRDQGNCGACVAFGSIAAVEASARIQQQDANLTVDLSEAQLFYCDAAQEGRTCASGWWVPNALRVLQGSGVADEACFPYNGADQPCHLCADWQARATLITGSHAVTDRNAVKSWLSTRGPLITCFSVYDDFFSYRSGVYHHVSGDLAGGHCVCVVGYSDAQQCWICKNSWGPGWGEGGFFRIAYGDSGIDAEMWAVEGILHGKVTLGERSNATPALATFRNQLVLAWAGTDNPSHLNVMSSSDGRTFGGKVTLDQSCIDGPAVAADGDRLFLAWAGTDNPSHLNVMSSTDGRTFGGKVTLGDAAAFGPALAVLNGRLFLAWAGTDGGHHLNVMSSSDGSSWGGKVTLNESTLAQVALCSAGGLLYLIWAGTDGSHALNLLQSSDGHTWTGKITLGDTSDHAPAAVQGGQLVLGWTGRDSHLNRMLSRSGSHGFGDKITFGDMAVSGVALAEFDGKTSVAWTGTDGNHSLNVMLI